jgi:hypothetical protein
MELRREIEEFLKGNENKFPDVLKKSEDLYKDWMKIIRCGMEQHHRK